MRLLQPDMAGTSQRILVHVHRKGVDQAPVLAKFTQSVLDYFEDDRTKNQSEVCAELNNNRLIVTDKDNPRCQAIKIRRPAFCPIHGLTPKYIAELPDDILNRGIDTGAAVILESCDNKVLLTRRSKSLRTFPGVWVPPDDIYQLSRGYILCFILVGGHLEKDETFIEAGLRELREETGLNIKPSDCEGGDVKVLALWESVYPPKLTLGLPKRHHIVVYLYGKLTSKFTAEKLLQEIKLAPDEAEACGWFDMETIQKIVDSKEDGGQQKSVPESVADKFKGLIVNDSKQQEESYLPLNPLFNVCADMTDSERVSTGTKFALEEWLHFKKQQK